MSIIKPTPSSAPVFYPKNDYTIVKYIDLTKFISLLHRESLFFCRLDKLEDQFEGTTAKANFDVRIRWYQQTNHLLHQSLTHEEILKHVEELYEHERKLKALNCVNCWNKKNIESAALWKIYSDFSKGIMIKSSISRIEKALEETKEDIKLSEIRYIDYNNETMLDGNTMYPLIHKQTAYSYEDEVRLIYEVMPEFGWEYDWTKEEVQEGFYLKTDLNELIDEVVIGPYSPEWFLKLVQDIANKYGLNKLITKSQLSLNK